MIIDDSAVVRQTISHVLGSDACIEVIGASPNPLLALERMKSQWPDVIVLDLELPGMDGITFLKKISAERATPAIICTALPQEDAKTKLEALSAQIPAIFTKPEFGLKYHLENSANAIIDAIRTAARNAPQEALEQPTPSQPEPYSEHNYCPLPGAFPAPARTTDPVVAIGTSTGGTVALEAMLTKLPSNATGIVIVQHMPAVFTAMFSDRLNQLCKIEVREAKNGDRVQAGRALIAPGGKHMTLKRNGAQYTVEVSDGPLVNRHKPSVDVLFRSVAQTAGANALGIIMTGMGDDGARGLKEMNDAGAKTIAQDEASCTVFGMPKEAIKLGAADLVMPLDRIPTAIVGFSSSHATGSK